MHALDSLPSDASPARRFWKGIGIMMLITGIALLIGALSGAKSALQPLSGLTSSSLTTQHTSLFTRVQSETQLNQAIKAAEGKLVMLDFYADWCVSCKEYEQFVFTDPRVQQQLKHMVLLQADVTANNEQDQALLKRFNLFGPPGIIFFDANGQEIAPHIVGYKNADAFLTILKQLSTERST
jgi:thiol:disulfide interchange protein DsbD